MKNFPHQFNNLSKLFSALETIRDLITSNKPVTDEAFGELLTKKGIYTYRDKVLSIEQFLAAEKLKPTSNRGYLTVARDIRRFFELLNFIELTSSKSATLTNTAEQLLSTTDDLERKNVWRNSLNQLKLAEADGEQSHPYQILIRLVKEYPGIETVKLMLALEANNDSEEEFQRILNLAKSRNIHEIIEYIGTSKSMAANAVKILPGIAEQLGDINRVGNKSFLGRNENYSNPNLDSSIDDIIDDELSDDDGLEDEIEDPEYEPFDPEKISIDTKGLTMEAILRRLEQGTIKLNPLFQRNEVWTSIQKSRLIESLMLKIPIPMFYVSADEKGTFSVVDGLQRLSTIRSFVLGDKYLETKDPKFRGHGFKLDSLEFWHEKYDGLKFVDLPVNIQNRILETEFTFTIINPGTPEEVKRNVFSRINKGGAPLNMQEIRHALYNGVATQLLQDLRKEPSFLDATDYSISYVRMKDSELILRFLSFTVRNYDNYYKSNDMDSFLSDTMRIINIMPDLKGKDATILFPDESDKEKVIVNDIQTLRRLFITAMSRAKVIFDRHAFRKSYGSKKRTQINKALFEVWSVVLSQLTENQFHALLNSNDSFQNEYANLLDDVDFSYSISRDSLKYISVQYRFETIINLLNQYTNVD